MMTAFFMGFEKKKKLFTIAFFVFAGLAVAQNNNTENTIPEEFCITSDEVHLYRLINEYRLLFGLEVIPHSKSLSYVAHTHVRDLFHYRPDLESCNLHSWSDRGNWTPCCYSKDPNRTNCMWNKPRELTGYMGNGQELILYENIPATPLSAIDQWRNFELTNDMILNRGRWTDKSWKAIGIAIYEGYASVWFGEVDDVENKFSLCGEGPELTSDWLIAETAEVAKEETISEPESEVAELRYFLIVSSFKDETQAKSEMGRLQAGGYTEAKVLFKNDNYRVSVFDYKELSEAQKMRRQLDAVFKGIWIMEKEGF